MRTCWGRDSRRRTRYWSTIAVVNFLIVAFALFLLIRAMNAMKSAEAPAPPPGPSKEETLLTEIRDLLARR